MASASAPTVAGAGAGGLTVVLRIRAAPAWTAEEDARLERLAAEHGFRHWRAVASQLPGRSSGQCRDRWRHHLARDVYHRPFTAGDDEDLARLYVRHGGRWREMSRAVHGRTSRSMRRRWREVRDSHAVLRKLWTPRPPGLAAAADDDDEETELASGCSCSSSSTIMAVAAGFTSPSCVAAIVS